jgi:hypothetical protein
VINTTTTKEIQKGDIVNYKGQYVRVKTVFKDTLNLCHVWGGRFPTFKKVPKTDVFEDGETFMTAWRKSEHYMCM